MQVLTKSAGKRSGKPVPDGIGRVLYLPAIEKVTPVLRRPEVRLRFINGVIAFADEFQRDLERSFRRFPRLKKGKLYRWLLSQSAVLGVSVMADRDQGLSVAERQLLKRQSRLPWYSKQLLLIARRERLLYSSGITAAILGLGLLFTVVFFATFRVNAYLAGRAPGRHVSAGPAPQIPDLPQSQQVWLVEKKDGFERYSNALRVVTSYETTSRPRQFQLVSHDLKQILPTMESAPKGILFHTSESNLVPFTPGNNTSITNISTYLLEYVRRNKSYNYLIDRFGQVYRIVPDNQVANHAGRSLWGDDQGLFIELNESFIGVCFEMRSGDAGREQLTEAQVISGRLLTGALRSLYQIPDADCTTHGLVSVNPDNMLIAYHSDWLTGFPFDALGLTDKAKVPPASLADIGFGYDAPTVELLGGKLTPGMTEALAQFNQTAAQLNLKPSELREQRRQLYLQHQERIRAGHDETKLPERSAPAEPSKE
jgi:hypothetical protein